MQTSELCGMDIRQHYSNNIVRFAPYSDYETVRYVPGKTGICHIQRANREKSMGSERESAL